MLNTYYRGYIIVFNPQARIWTVYGEDTLGTFKSEKEARKFIDELMDNSTS